MKIYIPQTAEVRNRVIKEISGTEEFDYICNANEYRLLRELSEEEFNALDIHSEEHEIGNVLVYETGESFILDGLGYFRVDFKQINKNLTRRYYMSKLLEQEIEEKLDNEENVTREVKEDRLAEIVAEAIIKLPTIVAIIICFCVSVYYIFDYLK